MYRQCDLRRGNRGQMAWIPSALAKKGRFLKILGEDGWKIMAVYGISNGDYLTIDGRDYRGEFGSLQ